MYSKRLFTSVVALSLPLVASGCGLYTPMLEAGDDVPENHVTGVLVNKIVDHVKCELGRAILYEINYDKANAAKNHVPRNLTWLDTSSGTLTITMSVDEKGSLAPGATWTDPLQAVGKTAQSFSLGLGASASADATRKQQVDFVFDVKKDFVDNKQFREFNDSGLTPAPCKDEYGRALIEGDLRIREWLDSAVFARDITKNVDMGPPDVLTDDITFVVAYSASVTPSWKLVRWSVNPSSPFANASRTRTNEALIALGPAGKTAKGKGAAPSGPSQTVIDFRNITLMGSALSISLKNQ